MTGTLRARPTAGGGAEQTLATGSDVAVPSGGSVVVFSANVTGVYPDQRADVRSVDLATGNAVTIATQAYDVFDVLADRRIVYVEPGVGLHIVTPK